MKASLPSGVYVFSFLHLQLLPTFSNLVDIPATDIFNDLLAKAPPWFTAARRHWRHSRSSYPFHVFPSDRLHKSNERVGA